MDIKEIEKIAHQTGVGFYMREGRKLVKMDDGSIEFVNSQSLTPYGESLVDFANAIEQLVMTRCNDGTAE